MLLKNYDIFYYGIHKAAVLTYHRINSSKKLITNTFIMDKKGVVPICMLPRYSNYFAC